MELFTNSIRYPPLQHDTAIRVVRLLPGAFDDPILCVLEHAEIEMDAKYYALSYVWGDPQVRVPTLLNGVCFPVTSNLEHALRFIREQNVQTLWIDAICIDQGNFEERGRQVQMMALVYQRAKAVLIWVGDEDPVGAIDGLTKENMIFCKGNNKKMNTAALFFCLEKLARGEDILPVTRCGIVWSYSVAEFFNRPWFHRLWVVQEAAANINTAVVCGSRSIQLMVLLAALDRVPLTLGFPVHMSDTFVEMFRNAWALQQCLIGIPIWTHNGFRIKFPVMDKGDISSCIVQVLSTLHGRFKCLDPRDRLYGILGIVTDPSICLGEDILKVDYNKSPTQLFKELAIWLLEQRPYLDILPRGCDNKFPELPSWVSTWAETSSGTSYQQKEKISPARFRFSTDKKTLFVQGVPLGGLDIVTDPAPKVDNVHQIQTLLRWWEKEILMPLQSTRKYKGPAEALEAWKTLLLRGTGMLPFNKPDSEILKGYKHVKRTPKWPTTGIQADLIRTDEIEQFWYEIIMERGYYRTTPVPHPLAQTGAVGLSFILCTQLTGRSAFLLDTGDIGLTDGGYVVEKSDIVCLCFGSSVPFILRKEGSFFRFLGTCYVYDVVDQKRDYQVLQETEVKEFGLN